jgi:hypothetical protein
MLARPTEALATAGLITAEDLEGEERNKILIENYLQIARYTENEEERLKWLEEALKLGVTSGTLASDESFGEFRKSGPFRELLTRYEK